MGSSGTLGRIHRDVMHLRKLAILLLITRSIHLALRFSNSLSLPVVGQFGVVAAIRVCGIAKWRPPDQIGTGFAASASN
jgi:hypothetical protein